MLDSHPRICCGPELRTIAAIASLFSGCREGLGPVLEQHYGVSDAALREVFGGLTLAFLEPLRRSSGKPRTAEKTPGNLLAFPDLARLFPDSPLVHVIRDGRDVTASRLAAAWAGGAGERGYAAAHRHASEWAQAMALGAEMRRRPCDYVEIRYEALASDPERVMRRLLAALDEPWHADVLRHHQIEREVDGVEEWSADQVRRPVNRDSLGRWRRDLRPDEIAAVKDAAGAALIEAGYAHDLAW